MRLATLLLAATLTVMSGAAIAPALPSISEHFSSEPSAQLYVKLLLSITAVFIAISGPLSGYIADKYGRKRLLVSAMVAYGITGSAGLYLDSLFGIIVSRAMFGLTVGACMTTLTALIIDYYRGGERRKVLGYQGSAMSFGGVAFLLFGGMLAEIGWRAPFAIYLGAFIFLPLVLLFIDDPVLVKPKTVDITLGKSKRDLFILLSLYCLAFLSVMLFYLIPVELPFYMMGMENGSSASRVGIAIAFSTLSGGFIAAKYRFIRSKLNYHQIAGFTFAAMFLSFFLVTTAASYSQIILAMIINGLGVGLLFPNFNTWVSDYAEEDNKGRVLGGLTFSVYMGMFATPFFVYAVKKIFPNARIFSFTSLLLLCLSLSFFFIGRAIGQNKENG